MIKRFYRASIMYGDTDVFFELNCHTTIPNEKRLIQIFQEKLDNVSVPDRVAVGLCDTYRSRIYYIEEQFATKPRFVTYLNEDGETFYLK